MPLAAQPAVLLAGGAGEAGASRKVLTDMAKRPR
jgi:hypothetical protein